MAVPLIITVTPTEGLTGGNNSVELKTNNARLPPAVSSTGYVGGSVQETVQVFFGTAQATKVQVVSKGRVLCRAPKNSPGTYDVTMKNLDDNGDVIPGEEYTKAAAYTTARPDLTYDPAKTSDFVRIIETLILAMRSEIIDNVGLTVHTDYDEETGDYINVTKQAELPALTLIGPDVLENRFHTTNEIQYSGISPVIGLIPPYTVDLQFQIIGASESTRQLIELLFATVQFFHRNSSISMLCDPDNPSLGSNKWDMDFIEEGGEPEVTSKLGQSNVRSFSATVFIRGFDLADFRGVADDTLVSVTERIKEVVLCTSQLAVDVDADPQPIPPVMPAAPDVGDFDIVIKEQES